MNSLYQLNSDAVARQCAQSRADAAYWEALKNNKLRYLEEANSRLTQTVDHQASRRPPFLLTSISCFLL